MERDRGATLVKRLAHGKRARGYPRHILHTFWILRGSSAISGRRPARRALGRGVVGGGRRRENEAPERSTFVPHAVGVAMPLPEYGAKNPPKSFELYAAGKFIGDKCLQENMEFYSCKDSSGHPSKCLEEGKRVQACVYGVMNDLLKKAPKEMQDYAACLDEKNLKIRPCRRLQQAFEDTVLS